MAIAMERVLRLLNTDGPVDVLIEVFWPERRKQSWFSDWKIGWPDRERRDPPVDLM